MAYSYNIFPKTYLLRKYQKQLLIVEICCINEKKNEDVKKKISAAETVESWGKPLGLPSPLPPSPRRTNKTQNSSSRGNNATQRTSQRSGGGSNEPIYLDLTYVPHHGDAR